MNDEAGEGSQGRDFELGAKGSEELLTAGELHDRVCIDQGLPPSTADTGPRSLSLGGHPEHGAVMEQHPCAHPLDARSPQS